MSANDHLNQLLDDLRATWPDFSKRPSYYCFTYVPSLLDHREKGTFREKFLLSVIEEKISLINLGQLLFNRYQELRAQKVIERIKAELEQYNFDEAAHLYRAIQDIYPRETYNQLVSRYENQKAKEERRRFVAATLDEIRSRLDKNDFAGADVTYDQIKNEYSEELYQSLVQKQKKLQARNNLIEAIRSCLKEGNFASADKLFHSSSVLTDEEYLQIKSPYVQEFVKNRYSISINPEKAMALARTSQNMLLSARAGSGKTMVMACKTSMLIDCENINPDDILVMTFNRSAASEIRNRIQRDYKHPEFDNARTFHSLAHQLVQPTKDLLFDETEDLVTRKMTLFVQQLLKEHIRNPIFIEKMYEFFRKEMREIERAGFLLDDKTYFDFRRNLLQVTLNGEKVKSFGEKVIADFLFEHDISYGYEKIWLWGSNIYRPDFSIYEQQKDYIIEHWGIDEFDPQKQVPSDWTQTWDEYYAEMQAKRAFWQDKSAVLIETSIRDLRNGRETFESILSDRLIRSGINKPKLTSNDLHKKLMGKDYTITRISELFAQFIQRAKKQALSFHDVQKLLLSYHPKDEREKVFLDLACRVYMEYEQALSRQEKIDFDDLMMQAILKVHESRGECEIYLGNPKNRPMRMNDLRWILIDEYQDFSELFYRLVTAIRAYNPSVQLFCVGDDWQAINGFAGSDLRFFENFKDWVNGAQIAYLLTNFRSRAAIVKNGNALMSGLGRPGESLPENSGGDVFIEYMDDVWIELRNSDDTSRQKIDDERFIVTEAATNGTDKKYNRIIASKYLKKCYQIITASENFGKSVAILSRTNRIDGVSLNDFKNRLIASFSQTDIKVLGDPKDKIHVQTAHKYKGLQAELVIILGACDGSFPLLHPDNALFEIFGKTLLDAFVEERRLFYVALTRAKSSLYILTEKGRESAFLSFLPIYHQSSSSGKAQPTRTARYSLQLSNDD